MSEADITFYSSGDNHFVNDFNTDLYVHDGLHFNAKTNSKAMKVDGVHQNISLDEDADISNVDTSGDSSDDVCIVDSMDGINNDDEDDNNNVDFSVNSDNTGDIRFKDGGDISVYNSDGLDNISGEYYDEIGDDVNKRIKHTFPCINVCPARV